MPVASQGKGGQVAHHCVLMCRVGWISFTAQEVLKGAVLESLGVSGIVGMWQGVSDGMVLNSHLYAKLLVIGLQAHL